MHINELTFLVLTGLAGGPQHGYGIVKEIEDMTDGAVKPPVASLYRALDRMEREGHVVEHAAEVVDGRFRRTYRLTEEGRRALSDAATQRAQVTRLARRRLRATAGRPGMAGGFA